MSKILVLAEKPSVGRDLAKVLKCNSNKGSYIEGSKYIVTWAMGHLVGLMDPEGYDNKYKEWKMDTLPMLPKHMKLVVLKKTGKQFNEVKRLMNRDDVVELYKQIIEHYIYKLKLLLHLNLLTNLLLLYKQLLYKDFHMLFHPLNF